MTKLKCVCGSTKITSSTIDVTIIRIYESFKLLKTMIDGSAHGKKIVYRCRECGREWV